MVHFFLLYLSFRNFSIAATIFSAIPVSFAAGMVAIAIAGVEMNTAIWIGFIALFGIAVDDGVVMATYIQQLVRRRSPNTIEELRETVYVAGMKRVRPCLMTTATTLLALIPVLTSRGRGSDIMIPMAIPCFGGMMIEIMTMLVVPVLYCLIEEVKFRGKKIFVKASS